MVYVVCVPNVKYLNFEVYLVYENMKIVFEGMSDLPAAWISIDFDKGYYSDVVSGLSGLENLNFRSESFTEMMGELPKFKKLKDLSLGDCCMNCAYGYLSSFLNHCPNLENLDLRHRLFLPE